MSSFAGLIRIVSRRIPLGGNSASLPARPHIISSPTGVAGRHGKKGRNFGGANGAPFPQPLGRLVGHPSPRSPLPKKPSDSTVKAFDRIDLAPLRILPILIFSTTRVTFGGSAGSWERLTTQAYSELKWRTGK